MDERIQQIHDLQLYLWDLEEKLKFETSIFNRQYLWETIGYLIMEIDDLVLKDRGDDE